MSRKKGSKNKVHKQFCLNGHDVLICGRSNTGNCRDCERARGLQYYQDHTEEVNATNNRCYARDRLKILKNQKVYEKENRSKILATKLARRKVRRATDPVFKLKEKLRGRLHTALVGKKKQGSAVKDLGCGGEFLKDYIAAKFSASMTWDNWGKIWELDHIVPLWKFNLEDREQFLKAVHYTNLQPLTVEDHARKSANEVREWIKYQQELKKTRGIDKCQDSPLKS
jgi:hypothetical protein